MADFVRAVKAGGLRVQLEALRDLLAERLVAAEPRESAALAKQLADVLRTLDGLVPAERSKIDDLAGRRSKRRAAVSKRAGSDVKRGSGGG